MVMFIRIIMRRKLKQTNIGYHDIILQMINMQKI